MTNLSKSIDEDNQGLVSGYAANMQSIAQIIAPLLAYWYLEIWSIELMGITLDAYFMIGFTCVAIMLSLISLALFDIKSNPELFKKGKIEPEEFKL
jgi:MFS family permease